MYRKIFGKNKKEFLKYIVPACLKLLVLDSVHSKVHQEGKRIKQLLHTRCYWVKMNEMVDKYCHSCSRFNIAKPPRIKCQEPAGMIWATRPFQIVSIDFTQL